MVISYQVTRYNMPTGTIGDSTTAASTIGSSTTPHTFTVPVGAIPDGDVTIAASVHQRRTTSSDIFFELSLLPVVCNCTSSLEYTVVRPPYLQQLTDSQVSRARVPTFFDCLFISFLIVSAIPHHHSL